MALLIGLVAAAARTMANNDDRGRQNYNNGYNNNSNGYNNGQYYDNQNNGYGNDYNRGYLNGYNNGYTGNNNNNNPAPYAAYAPQMGMSRRDERRMNKRMRKAERHARDADLVMSLMSSGSRGAPRSSAPSGPNMQPPPINGGMPYMQRGDNSRGQATYSPVSRGVMVSEPEASQWRHVQSRNRSASREDLRPGSSSEGLPTYEQAVRGSGKS